MLDCFNNVIWDLKVFSIVWLSADNKSDIEVLDEMMKFVILSMAYPQLLITVTAVRMEAQVQDLWAYIYKTITLSTHFNM